MSKDKRAEAHAAAARDSQAGPATKTDLDNLDVKKLKGPTTLRHSRESGNPLPRFRKNNRADIADERLRIPAFAGMTKSY